MKRASRLFAIGLTSSSISLAGMVAASVLGAGCSEAKKAPAGPPPPATVLVAPVTRRDLSLAVETMATLDGYVNAEIRARVKGYLQSQAYKDGAAVKTGQLLFTLEPTEYSSAVSSAKAAVARAKAAQNHNATQYARDNGLFKTGVVSKQDVDNSAASVADADGQVQAAEALLTQAELNLSYTRVLSPIDGVAGLALVRIGNLVGQDGPTLLTTVSQIDPIRVTFPISETDFIKSTDRFKNLDNRDLSWAKRQFAKLTSTGKTESGDPGIELLLSDGSVFPNRGVVVTANRQIDASTGTIQIQALFPNPDSVLRPGQFGRVRLQRSDEGRNVLVVPDKAIVSVQGSASVAVVGADNKVHIHRVELGSVSGPFRILKSGVNEGDRVVVEGTQKATEGSTVNPQPAPEISASAAAANVPPPNAGPAASAGAPASH